jgi:hypothetical protein
MKSIGVIAAAAAAVFAAVGVGAGVAAADYRSCGSANGWGVGADGSASCEFAFNVANNLSNSFYGSATTINAYSPVTGISYSVNCLRKYQLTVQCTAGNNAIIYLNAPHPGGNAG